MSVGASVVLPYPVGTHRPRLVQVNTNTREPDTASRPAPATALRPLDASRGGHRIEAAREWLRSGGSVLLFGPAVPSLSAYLDVLADCAPGTRVLRCSPTQDDARCAFRGLTSLLSSVTEQDLAAVPTRRRQALAILGCRGAATPGRASIRLPGGRRSTRATPADVRLAALTLFRVLAKSGPLLLIVENVQWLDQASAETLRLVMPRVADLPIRMAAAEWTEPDSAPANRSVCPSPLLVARLDPPTPVDTARTGGDVTFRHV